MGNTSYRGFKGILERVDEHCANKPARTAASSKPAQAKKTQAAKQSPSPKPREEFRWKMWLCIAGGAFVLWLMISSDDKKKHDYVPPAPAPYASDSYSIPEAAPAPEPKESELKATKPQNGMGYGHSLNASEILYCLSVKEFLDYLENRLTNNSQVSDYNSMTTDYNGRCGRFSYRSYDMTQAKEAFNKNIEAIRKQAQDWLKQTEVPVSSLPTSEMIVETSSTLSEIQNILGTSNIENSPVLNDGMPRYPLCQEKGWGVQEDAAARTVIAFGPVKLPPDAKTCTWPLKFVSIPGGGRALITTEGKPGDLCHGCSANLSLHTFNTYSTGDLNSSHWRFTEVGTWGDPGTITDVNLGYGRTGFAVESGGTFQGYTTSSLELYEVTTKSVTQILKPTILSRSDCGAKGDNNCETVEGKWVIAPDGKLQITYNGQYKGEHLTDTQNQYELSNGKFVMVLGSLNLEGY